LATLLTQARNAAAGIAATLDAADDEIALRLVRGA
jgi:hypothetical protein